VSSESWKISSQLEPEKRERGGKRRVTRKKEDSQRDEVLTDKAFERNLLGAWNKKTSEGRLTALLPEEVPFTVAALRWFAKRKRKGRLYQAGGTDPC